MLIISCLVGSLLLQHQNVAVEAKPANTGFIQASFSERADSAAAPRREETKVYGKNTAFIFILDFLIIRFILFDTVL